MDISNSSLVVNKLLLRAVLLREGSKSRASDLNPHRRDDWFLRESVFCWVFEREQF